MAEGHKLSKTLVHLNNWQNYFTTILVITYKWYQFNIERPCKPRYLDSDKCYIEGKFSK